MHWRRKWQPTPVFLPGESQGRGSLVGYHLWGHTVRHDWSNLAAAAALCRGENRKCQSVAGEAVYEETLQWGKIVQGVNFCYGVQCKAALSQIRSFVCLPNAFLVCFEVAPDIEIFIKILNKWSLQNNTNLQNGIIIRWGIGGDQGIELSLKLGVRMSLAVRAEDRMLSM